MKHRVWLALLLFHSALGIRQSALGQAPQLINYQGRLLNGTNLVNGTVGLSLRLFNVASGGTKIYEDSNTVTVADGLYSTFIGDHPSNDVLLVALTNAAVWVEVAVNGTALTPRERLSSVGYALATRGLLVTTNNSMIHNPSTNLVGVDSSYATIAGGNVQQIGGSSSYATIGGGRDNSILDASDYATIAGGYFNRIGTNCNIGFIGGGRENAISEASDFAVIAGGYLNRIGTNSNNGVIGGGYGNNVADSSWYATIAGGLQNDIGNNSDYSAIGGGWNNNVADSSWYATIAGGFQNDIGSNSYYAVIGGGYLNVVGANSSNAVVAGGCVNAVADNSSFATIVGGFNNAVLSNCPYAMIAGGFANRVGAGATNAFAAGRRAQANHAGAFVWGDNRAVVVASTNDNSVTFRAAGGYRLFTDGGLTLGAQLAPNATAWAALSDRNAKENFAPIDTAQILDRVAQLPLSAWSYKHDPEQRRYIGPMAQDFHAAFGLGGETTINTLDTDGVALAAIQALARENDEFRMANADLRKDVEELKARLRALEAK